MLSSLRTQRQVEFVAVISVMTFLGTVAICLRILCRFILMKRPGLDDAFMIMGWFFTLSFFILCIIGTLLGYGMHRSEETQVMSVTSMKLTLTIETVYYAVVTSIKVSICFLYLRFGVSRVFRLLCWGTITFLGVFFVTSEIVTLAQCIPMSDFWTVTATESPNCINGTAFFYTTSAIHIVIDIWLVGLPIKTLLRVPRPRRDKIVLLVVFGMGVFSCVASIVRLYSIQVYTTSVDPPYDATLVDLWSIVEVNVGIVCASVPAMKPLFSRRLREEIKSSRHPASKRVRSAESGYPLGALEASKASPPSTPGKFGKDGIELRAFRRPNDQQSDHSASHDERDVSTENMTSAGNG